VRLGHVHQGLRDVGRLRQVLPQEVHIQRPPVLL
jgi:hypothetical protein